MQTDEFERCDLVEKYPHLKKQIENGDFRILIETNDEGKMLHRIIRWPNLHVYGPDAKFVQHLVFHAFSEIPLDKIVFRTYGITGLEITSR